MPSVAALALIVSAFAVNARLSRELRTVRAQNEAMARSLARVSASAGSMAGLKEENDILLETLRVADADSLAARYSMRDAVADLPARARPLPGYSH
jgi:hypothetical protein